MIKGLAIVCHNELLFRIAIMSTNETSRKMNRNVLGTYFLSVIDQNSGNKHLSESFKSKGFKPVFNDSLIIFESPL